MSSLIELLNTETDYSLTGAESTTFMLENSSQRSISPAQAELNTPSCTNPSPSSSSIQTGVPSSHPQAQESDTFLDLSDSFEQNSNSSTHTLSPGAPTEKRKSTKTPSSKGIQAEDSRVQKRTLNTLAARRYRQKRLDQMSELEAALKETQAERDALKVRVARLEGEVDVLRGLLR